MTTKTGFFSSIRAFLPLLVLISLVGVGLGFLASLVGPTGGWFIIIGGGFFAAWCLLDAIGTYRGSVLAEEDDVDEDASA